ncbi:MAG: LVIVD repeat-containing protein [Thermogutta sp.]
MQTKHTCFTLVLRLALILTVAQIPGTWQVAARYEFADQGVVAPPAAPSSQMYDMVGHLGGSNNGIFVQGNYAYATFNQELAVLNVADPTHPTRVGYVALSSFGRDVYVANGYAYVTIMDGYIHGENDLAVVNVSDPTRPVVVGLGASQIHDAQSVHVVGNYAYLVGGTGGSGGFAIINISNPISPTEAGFYSGLEPARDISVVGNYAYVAAEPGLKVVNVSNPANPTLAGALALPGQLQGVYVAGGHAYVTTEVWNNPSAHNFYVVDISNPTNPTQAGSVRVWGGFPGQANGVYVVGNYAYIAGAYYVGWQIGNYGGIQVVDVSDPHAPTNVKRYFTPDFEETYRIHVAGNHAFLSGRDDGLLVMDVSNPANPTEAAHYRIPTSTEGLAVSGNYVYLADYTQEVLAVNVSNPALPSPAGFWATTQTTGASHDVAVSGQYAYIADVSGLHVLNISDPTHLVHITTFLPPGQSYGWFEHIRLSGNYAYLIDSSNDRLWIVNIANPAAPTAASSFGGDTLRVTNVCAIGNYAYVVGDGGLWVLDVSDPAQPTQVGHNAAMLYLTGVDVVGNHAFVVGGAFFRVVDVSNPANPTEVYSLPLPESNGQVYVSGSYAYVTTCYYGLRVFDISNPANPTQVGEYNTTSCAKKVRVAGDYIYIADGDDGLTVLTAPALRATPAAVTWLVAAGGPDPMARVVTVESTGRPLTWTAVLSPTVSWLAAAPLSGTTPTTITLTAAIAGLPIGQYNTQLIVTAGAGIGNSPQTIPITLIVAQEVYGLYLPLILR